MPKNVSSVQILVWKWLHFGYHKRLHMLLHSDVKLLYMSSGNPVEESEEGI